MLYSPECVEKLSKKSLSSVSSAEIAVISQRNEPSLLCFVGFDAFVLRLARLFRQSLEGELRRKPIRRSSDSGDSRKFALKEFCELRIVEFYEVRIASVQTHQGVDRAARLRAAVFTGLLSGLQPHRRGVCQDQEPASQSGSQEQRGIGRGHSSGAICDHSRRCPGLLRACRIPSDRSATVKRAVTVVCCFRREWSIASQENPRCGSI